MNQRYAMYAVALVVGGGVALWAGLSPFFVLLLACPLMMFMMMRGGMHGGMNPDSDSSRDTPRDVTPHQGRTDLGEDRSHEQR